MSTEKIYCLSLQEVQDYLVGNNRLSMYPLDAKFSHAIRQIVDLAMDTFEERHLVIPALPQKFSIDTLPKGFENEWKNFLKKCITMDLLSINLSYSEDKMIICLE